MVSKEKKNKILKKIVLAVIGGIDVIFIVSMPLLLGLLVITVFSWKGYGSAIFIVMSFISSFYRAIKIGFLK
jgi:hypothetical protein